MSNGVAWDAASAGQEPSFARLLAMGAWFGLVTGLVEGVGLMIFQRVNWENWGRALHVSGSIVWVSAFVDLFLFTAVAACCAIIARLFPRFPALRVCTFLFVGLAVYDWLAVTERLYPLACLLMAIGAAVAAQRWISNHRGPQRWFARSLPWVLVLLVLAFAYLEGSRYLRERRAVADLPAARADAPNVLIVIMDALRADHVSAYGYQRQTSPEIDRLAREGVLFENAISPSSWSLPSHASLLTGRSPHEHGAENSEPKSWIHWEPSLHGYRMLGQALAQEGYRTAAFSGNRVFFTHNNGFGRGFHHFADYFQSPKDAILRTLYGREFVRLYLSRHSRYVLHKRADVINTELTEWIDRDHSRPFLAVLNYFDVHDPYGGPGDYPQPSWGMKTETDQYDAGVKYTDDYLARLVQDLERRGLARNTIIVITADHGESLGEHGLRTHGRALYWELLHVPLIIWYPQQIPSGAKVARPVTNAAIPATVMELVNSAAKPKFPGPSLTALWANPAAQDTWPLPLSELARNPYPEKEEKLADQIEPTSTTGAMRSLVTPQWHLIAHENLGDQLYDWVHDPQERNNLVHTAEGHAIALQLLSSLPSSQGKLRTAAIRTISEGTFDAPQPEPQGVVNDYYRVLAAPGSKVTIEIRAKRLQPASHLDPVLAIQDEHGEPLRSCRNPGDDHLPWPAISDPTPDAFDDLCLNDDIAPKSTDSRLEFLAPAASTSPVELYVHVLDWNQLEAGRKSYQVSVTGALRPDGIVAPAGQGSATRLSN